MGVSTFLPRIRQTPRGFTVDVGKLYDAGPSSGGQYFLTLRAAREFLARQLRAKVKPGDRIEVDGGTYPDPKRAAELAPVDTTVHAFAPAPSAARRIQPDVEAHLWIDTAAERHRVSTDLVRHLLRLHGSDRTAVDAALGQAAMESVH